MPSEIKLRDGQTITAREDPTELIARFQTPLEYGALIEVRSAKGVSVWINPDAVVTIGKPGFR